MEFAKVAAVVDGVPHMSKEEGRRIYDHVRATRPRDVLDIGTANGVSAAYIAAALDANGGGSVTTIDHVSASYQPGPAKILDATGLAHLVRRVVVEDSSYTWWLKSQVEANSDEAGNCTPIYDFCYLDGAHNWTIDGLAALLVEKLLRPGGWLLLDDLGWSYAGSSAGAGQSADDLHLSRPERTEPHMRAVFDLLVRQHPSFTEFRVENEWWGWAHKAPGEPRRYESRMTVSLGALIARRLRRALGMIRSAKDH